MRQDSKEAIRFFPVLIPINDKVIVSSNVTWESFLINCRNREIAAVTALLRSDHFFSKRFLGSQSAMQGDLEHNRRFTDLTVKPLSIYFIALI